MLAEVDLHTHTIASGHATSDTITDMAKEAAKRGVKVLGICDHAPAMPAAAKESYFRNLAFCDRTLFGVKILYGAELNVSEGGSDLGDDILKKLDYAVASLHKDVYKPINAKFDTATLIAAAKNRYVNVLGHPFDVTYDIDEESLVYAAKETLTAIELNSVGLLSGGYRKQDLSKIINALKLAKEKKVFVALGSDSHGAGRIGDLKDSLKILGEVGFPEELVLNSDVERFMAIVKEKRRR